MMYNVILVLLQTLPFGWHVGIETRVGQRLYFLSSVQEDIEAFPYWSNTIVKYYLAYDPKYAKAQSVRSPNLSPLIPIASWDN